MRCAVIFVYSRCKLTSILLLRSKVTVNIASTGNMPSEKTVVQFLGKAESGNSLTEWKHTEWGQDTYDTESYARLCDMWNGGQFTGMFTSNA